MNNLKFRAWHKRLKRIFPVYEVLWPRNTLVHLSLIVGDLIQQCTIDEIELMQWTGLIDKNGKDIYDGDIFNVGWGDDIGMMKTQWNSDKCNFYFQWMSEPYDWFYSDEFCESDCEIIGNIYENGDLLEAKV